MSDQDEIESNVIDITARLNRLRAATMDADATAALIELDGLAHSLRYLDLVLRVKLQVGAPVENYDDIIDYLEVVRRELEGYMKMFGLSPPKG